MTYINREPYGDRNRENNEWREKITMSTVRGKRRYIYAQGFANMGLRVLSVLCLLASLGLLVAIGTKKIDIKETTKKIQDFFARNKTNIVEPDTTEAQMLQLLLTELGENIDVSQRSRKYFLKNVGVVPLDPAIMAFYDKYYNGLSAAEKKAEDAIIKKITAENKALWEKNLKILGSHPTEDEWNAFCEKIAADSAAAKKTSATTTTNSGGAKVAAKSGATKTTTTTKAAVSVVETMSGEEAVAKIQADMDAEADERTIELAAMYFSLFDPGHHISIDEAAQRMNRIANLYPELMKFHQDLFDNYKQTPEYPIMVAWMKMHEGIGARE